MKGKVSPLARKVINRLMRSPKVQPLVGVVHVVDGKRGRFTRHPGVAATKAHSRILESADG